MGVSVRIGRVKDLRQQLRTIEKKLKGITREIDDTFPGALKHGLKPIFDKSQQLVPVDSGALRNSGYLEEVNTARGHSVQLGYGRRGKPFYTVIVHERTDLSHASPTQAKFLEHAINLHAGEILPRTADFIAKKILGRR